MSFLTEVAVRRMATVSRTSIVRSAPRAAFSSSIVLQKTATETAKDAMKTVDRAVSDKIVDGIDVTTAAAQKVKAASAGAKDAASAKASELEGKAAEMKGEAKGKANEVAGQAKGAAHEAAGKAKGKADEVQRKL